MEGVDEIDRLVIAARVVEGLLERIGAEEGEVAGLRLKAGGSSKRKIAASLGTKLPTEPSAPALSRRSKIWRRIRLALTRRTNAAG